MNKFHEEQKLRIRASNISQVGNLSGKYLSQKTVTFQDLFLSDKDRIRITGLKKKKENTQREIICKGNKIMDFPDMSSLTWARRNSLVPTNALKSGTTPKGK